ncbi:MAG: glycosyltransferase family 4 protein [Chloroflexi bacterium]|nr:glycosyltransferase family 4 protein [Chloroflexota bacterium]
MSAKRIVVCTAQTPFVQGGAELHVASLHRALLERGYESDIVRVPFLWYPKAEVLKGYLAWRLLDLTESEGQKIDMVIATKFPSYVVRHPNKVVWLIQQFRQAYDLFGTEHSHFTNDPGDTRLRQIIRQIDNVTLSEAKRIFTNARNTANRLLRFNGLHAEPLYAPPPLDGHYRCDSYGDYLLVVSRLNILKRVNLIVEAMAQVRSGVQCLIAGRGEEEDSLRRLARDRGVANRVKFLGFVPDDQLIELYANCFSTFYGPYDEDYGLATVEAMKSHKPVLTVSDAGGVLEFVEDGVTGYVTRPGDHQELATRIDQLFADRALCQRLGETGYEKVREITWDKTIELLLGG